MFAMFVRSVTHPVFQVVVKGEQQYKSNQKWNAGQPYSYGVHVFGYLVNFKVYPVMLNICARSKEIITTL
jgi:hypothetical protein